MARVHALGVRFPERRGRVVRVDGGEDPGRVLAVGNRLPLFASLPALRTFLVEGDPGELRTPTRPGSDALLQELRAGAVAAAREGAPSPVLPEPGAREVVADFVEATASPASDPWEWDLSRAVMVLDTLRLLGDVARGLGLDGVVDRWSGGAYATSLDLLASATGVEPFEGAAPEVFLRLLEGYLADLVAVAGRVWVVR